MKDKQQSYAFIVAVLLFTIIVGSIVYSSLRKGVPIDESWVKISKDRALQILKESSQVDPKKDIINGSLIYAEPLVIILNWVEYLRYTGYHDRIYVSPTPTDMPKRYWIMEFETIRSMHDGSYGKYIVDATTGEVMLALEDHFGPPGLFDFRFSIEPDCTSVDEPLIIQSGETKSVVMKIVANPTYNASLPLTLKITKVPPGITVSSNATSSVLRANGTIVFILAVTAAPDAESIIYRPGHEETLQYIDVDIEFISYEIGTWIHVAIS